MNGLADSQVTCMLPVKDLQRARRFYEQSLGLEAGLAKPDGKFVYRCGSTEIGPRPYQLGELSEIVTGDTAT